MQIRNSTIKRPVAVVGRGDTLTARLLGQLIDHPIVELTPYEAAIAVQRDIRYRAVVVENFDPSPDPTLSPCAVARWELAPYTDVLVVGLDDAEGRRLAHEACGRVYTYSDGRPQADLTAKQVCLRPDGLEFQALTDGALRRVRLPQTDRPRLYDHLAALAGALALGMPLEQAVEILCRRHDND